MGVGYIEHGLRENVLRVVYGEKLIAAFEQKIEALAVRHGALDLDIDMTRSNAVIGVV